MSLAFVGESGDEAPGVGGARVPGGVPPAPLKRAEQVAAAIGADIVRMGWPVDEVIGSEPELVARYGVSRAVLREALLLLEHHQVAAMRRGRTGGLTVRRPDIGPLAESAALYLQFHGVAPEDLEEARTAIELTCARLAAEHATEQQVVRLRELCGTVPTSAQELAENAAEFHTVIAAASGNPALHVFARILHAITERLDHEPALAVVEAVQRAHDSIVDAIEVGDAPLAQRRMRGHVEAAAFVGRLVVPHDACAPGAPSSERAGG